MKQESGLRAASSPRHVCFARHAIAASIAAAFGTATPAWAQLPTSPEVVNGTANIATVGNQMLITNSPNAVLNWNTFDIGAQNGVHFEQVDATSKVLNRVTGDSASSILGSLSSNGSVWLINPYGILFGSTARVNVAGLVASAHAISNDDFLAGRATFADEARSDAEVRNQGQLRTSFGGRIWLVGRSVHNQGTVESAGGQVVMASGTSVEMVDSGLPHLTVRVAASDQAVGNTGSVLAADGKIDIHGGIVNQQGIVRATGLSATAGSIHITGKSGVTLASGSVTSANAAPSDGPESAGSIAVASETAPLVVEGHVSAVDGLGGKGGTITLNGRGIDVAAQALVDASGDRGGGTMTVDAAGAPLGIQGSIMAYGFKDRLADGGVMTLRGSAITIGEGGEANAAGDASGGVLTIDSPSGPVSVQGKAGVYGTHGRGGVLTIKGRGVNVGEKAELQVSGGGFGGVISVDSLGDRLVMDGAAAAYGSTDHGGVVTLEGEGVAVGRLASLDANGHAFGGVVSIDSSKGSLVFQGKAQAIGNVDYGGALTLEGADVTVTADGRLNADGQSFGGVVTVESATGPALVQGQLTSIGRNGDGGVISVLGPQVAVYGQAMADATGASGNGSVAIVASPQSPGSASYLGSNATLRANATRAGAGGEIIVESQGATRIYGSMEAKGGPNGGDGGRVTMRGGFLDALALDVDTGAAGIWLLEAGAMTIASLDRTVQDAPAFDIPASPAGSVVPGALVAAALARGTKVSLHADLDSTQNAATQQPGNLSVTANINPDGVIAGGMLTLRARHDVIVDGVNIDSGGLRIPVTIIADSDRSGAGDIHLLNGSQIWSSGGNISLQAGASGPGSGNVIHMQGSRIEAGNGTIRTGSGRLELTDAQLNSSASGDAIVMLTGAFANTNGQLSANNGRWLMYLDQGAGFRAEDFASLDARFVQVDAATNPTPVLSGAGQNGVLLMDPLQVQVKVNAQREYDGTVRASFTDALSSDLPPGFRLQNQRGDSAEPVIGAFADKYAGTDKLITYDGESNPFSVITSSGIPVYGAEQYYMGDILPRQLVLSGLVASNKVYDANRNATVTGALSNTIEGDDVSLSSINAQFDTKHAGSAKTVTVTVGQLAGADAFNYTLPATTVTTTADITRRPITVAGISAADKVYDGSLAATLSGSFSGALPGDTLVIGAPGVFDTRHVGSGKTVSFASSVLAGPDAANYVLTGPLSTTAAITPRPLALSSLVAASKVYDANRDASVTGVLSNLVAGDDVSVSGLIGTFDTKNAGTAKPVSVSGGALTGADAANYTLPAVAGSTMADITPRSLAVSSLVASSKVYDANRSASVTGSLSNTVAGDDVSLSGLIGTFDTKDAGTAKPVAVSGGALSGADAANYTLPAVAGSATADISRRAITVAGISAPDKVYDGTKAATLTGGFADALPGDSLAVGTTTVEFDTKNAGTNKVVSFTSSVLAGQDAANYMLTGPLSTTADITPRTLALSDLAAASKDYDASRHASVTGLLSNTIAGDDVSLSGLIGTFATKDAGTAKPVAVSGGVLAGADAANYTLPAVAGSTTADIRRREITAAGISAPDKVYDGTRAAALAGGFEDALPGDSLAVGTTTVEFDTKDVGTNKTVSFTSSVLAGQDAGNYILKGPLSTTASITPRTVTVAIGGQVAKEYDASANATLQAGQFVLNGAIAADSVGVSGPLQGSYDSADVGEQKAVTVTGTFTLTGADALNYSVAQTGPAAVSASGSVTASGNVGSITPATLAYHADPAIRDASLPVTGLGGTVSGFKGNDTLATATSGNLLWESSAGASSAPGTYAIQGAGLSARNYRFVQAPGNTGALLVRPNQMFASIQNNSTTAVTLAVISAIPAVDPRAGGTGVADGTGPTASKTFSTVRIGSLSQDELALMLAQRRDFKRKLFSKAIYKLEIDPSLADVRTCTTVAEASTGACRITPAQLELIHAAKPHAAAPAKVQGAKSARLPQIERKIAVLFGTNEYQDNTIPRLENAVPDVDAVSRLLADKLGYEVRVLHNPSKADIIRTLNALSTEIKSSDSVVVYYAGHGYSLEKDGAGYWLPSDAVANDPRQWISNSDVAKLLSGIRSKQMAVISDSCYSGAFAREGMATVGRNVNADDVLAKRSVVVLSSGGDEPVADEGKGNHSIFAWNLMKVVDSVANWKPGSTIFDEVQSGVKKEFPQTPKYGAVTAAGHQNGGDYLFELRSK